MLGFQAVSTRSTTNSTRRSRKFQSRAGFSGCLDLRSKQPRRRQQVSIPCWVFRLSRLLWNVGLSMALSFQSRAGFSGCLDSRRSSRTSLPAVSFNPVLGFQAVSTRTRVRAGGPRRVVSIPCWVFRLSRRIADRGSRGIVLVSIPCWVFRLSRRTRSSPAVCHTSFQSRAGFSGCLDRPARERDRRVRRVSIPCWVFRLSRPSRRDSGGAAASRFQSRAGFSGCLDPRSWRDPDADDEFQSRAGFSGCLDRRWIERQGVRETVSIPCWVFRLSRLPRRPTVSHGRLCFNPVLGFQAVSTSSRRRPS